MELPGIIIIVFFTAEIGLSAQLSPNPRSGSIAGQPVKSDISSGLLFYLSGNNDFKADFSAGGQAFTNYFIISSGASGKGMHTEADQLLSYWLIDTGNAIREITKIISLVKLVTNKENHESIIGNLY